LVHSNVTITNNVIRHPNRRYIIYT